MQVQFNQAFQDEKHQAFLWRADTHKAVLLIHGFPGTPAEMRSLGEHLHHTHGWTAQGVLLPGFGADLETLPQRTFDDWFNAIECAYLDLRQHHQQVVIAGLSMGGALSINLAAKYSPTALMLFAPFWTLDHILWKALPVLKYIFPQFKPFTLFKPDFNDPKMRAGIKNFMPQADLDDPQVQRAIMDMAIPVKMMDQVRIAGQHAYETATKLRVPTLIVQGLEDELVLPHLTRQLKTRFSHPIEHIELHGVHEILDPHATSWDDVQRTVDAFIHRHHL